MQLSPELEKLLPPPYEEDITDEEETEEEEESLSLCDLPVGKSNEDHAKLVNTPTGELGNDFEFDFGSLIGSVSALESDMCAADEVFSGGQMLPFRHSVSSEVGLSKFRVLNRGVSRSASMDRSRFGSCSTSSSRSSSTRSHQSNASSTTTTSISSSGSSNNVPHRIKTKGLPKTKTRNQFHSYPSPKARVPGSGARLSTSTLPSASKSTMWQVLRLGLVRTPEIELQGRSSIHINKSSNRFSIGNDSSHNPSTKVGDFLFNTPKRINRLSQEKSRSGGLFKSCQCGVGAIEPLPTNRVNKSNCNTSSSPKRETGKCKSLASQVLNEDKNKLDEEQQQKKNSYRQGKQGVSNHRTFEWLRDLSHPSVLNS